MLSSLESEFEEFEEDETDTLRGIPLKNLFNDYQTLIIFPMIQFIYKVDKPIHSRLSRADLFCSDIDILWSSLSSTCLLFRSDILILSRRFYAIYPRGSVFLPLFSPSDKSIVFLSWTESSRSGYFLPNLNILWMLRMMTVSPKGAKYAVSINPKRIC